MIAGNGLTGGSSGIGNLDPLKFFGHSLTTVKQQYWFFLIVLASSTAGLYFANQSRTGRAWRALREDPLAAEVMSIPVNRLKRLAFVIGCCPGRALRRDLRGDPGVGGLQLLHPRTVLIFIYAVVILGGIGSIAGVDRRARSSST